MISIADIVACRSVVWIFFFFKQKTAYEMRISDWSSDVCSSDLARNERIEQQFSNIGRRAGAVVDHREFDRQRPPRLVRAGIDRDTLAIGGGEQNPRLGLACHRSEEHTSELQSLMRISYAVFCLKNKNTILNDETTKYTITY